MKEIDLRALSCPIPVIRTKKALSESDDNVRVRVDAFAAKENIIRLVNKLSYKYDVSSEGDDWVINIYKK